jgi:hypothetical protein
MRQCRFCLEIDAEPMLSPCRCRGSVEFIHRECLHRWIREGDEIIEERLLCSLCKEPMFRLEPIPNPHDRRYILLYNSNVLTLVIHYAFFIFNLQSNKPLIYHFKNAEICLHAIYLIVYSRSIRTSHPMLYRDVLLARRSYLYWLLHLYFIYTFATEDSVMMAFASNFCITLHWNEHLHTLHEINSILLKN